MSKRTGYQTSLAGLVGAMILTLALIFAFVGFRALNRDDLEVRPDVIDHIPVVKAYQEGGTTVLYPASLPEGWKVTSLDNAPGSRPVFGMGMLTDDDKFVGYTWVDASKRSVLTERLGEGLREGDEVEIENAEIPGPWTEWSSDKDEALVTEFDERTLMVWGAVPRAEMETLIGELTTAPLGS